MIPSERAGARRPANCRKLSPWQRRDSRPTAKTPRGSGGKHGYQRARKQPFGPGAAWPGAALPRDKASAFSITSEQRTGYLRTEWHRPKSPATRCPRPKRGRGAARWPGTRRSPPAWPRQRRPPPPARPAENPPGRPKSVPLRADHHLPRVFVCISHHVWPPRNAKLPPGAGQNKKQPLPCGPGGPKTPRHKSKR